MFSISFSTSPVSGYFYAIYICPDFAPRRKSRNIDNAAAVKSWEEKVATVVIPEVLITGNDDLASNLLLARSAGLWESLRAEFARDNAARNSAKSINEIAFQAKKRCNRENHLSISLRFFIQRL